MLKSTKIYNLILNNNPFGIISKHGSKKKMKYLDWKSIMLLNILDCKAKNIHNKKIFIN